MVDAYKFHAIRRLPVIQRIEEPDRVRIGHEIPIIVLVGYLNRIEMYNGAIRESL